MECKAQKNKSAETYVNKFKAIQNNDGMSPCIRWHLNCGNTIPTSSGAFITMGKIFPNIPPWNDH